MSGADRRGCAVIGWVGAIPGIAPPSGGPRRESIAPSGVHPSAPLSTSRDGAPRGALFRRLVPGQTSEPQALF